MLDFLPYLSRIIGLVNDVLTLVGLIQQKQETLAQESYPFQLEGIGLNVQHQTLDVASFAGTIPAQIKNLTDLVSLNQLALLTAIAAAQQGGAAVTLPTHPPGDWADDISGGVAGLVWGYAANSFIPMTTLTAVSRAGAWAFSGADSGLRRFARSPYFALVWRWDQDDPSSLSFNPSLDPAHILSTDSLLTWLERENPSVAWSIAAFVYDGHYNTYVSGDNATWVCLLDNASFAALQAAIWPVAPSASLLWPGLAGVTLLTAVPFSDSFTISETMQGVLIAITSAPSKQGTFDFDGLVSYRNAGALAFLSDDGQAEISQPLGFTTSVYLPRSMASASSVKVRVTPGLGGTCTPFTIP